jgi:xylulokinase
MKNEIFADYSEGKFFKLVSQLAHEKLPDDCKVKFDPYLAGERASIEQKQAAFTGLTLATTRRQMLLAVIDALAKASGARLDLLKTRGVKIRHQVTTSGGTAKSLHDVLYRDWPGNWKFHYENEASLRGLSMLHPI